MRLWKNINNLANKIADYGAKYDGDTDVGKITINGTEHDIRNAVKGFDKKLVSDILFDQFEKYFSSNSSGALKLNGSDILDPTINLEMFWEIFKNYVHNNQGISDIDGSYPFADFAVWILALILAGLDILQIYNMVNDTKNPEEQPEITIPPLPKDPEDLLKEGWEETTHPKGGEKGHRKFKDPVTGLEVEFDKGTDGALGWRGKDHYHVKNPDHSGSGKKDMYLDENGNPVNEGSNPSHLLPNN